MTTAIAPTRKYFAADEVSLTPGERSFVCWVSTETVDHEGDLVVASGIDFKSVYMANPVVLAVHDMGTWPLGQAAWLKVKSTPQWTGLYGKALVDDTPDTAIVWSKIQSRTVRAVSITFRPPDDMKKGEWGPPTPEEVRKNPAWKNARRVIRRCVMIEFSIVPVPMNPDALIVAVAKGFHSPVFAEAPMSATDDHDETTEAAEVTATEATTEDETAAHKAMPAPERDDLEDDDEDDGDADGDDDEPPIRKGDHVKCASPNYKGYAVVASVHSDGIVPNVEEDIHGTKAMPACRVKCYKAMGDGHVPTSIHKGVLMKHCEKCDELKPPKKAKGVDHVKAASIEILPHEVRSADDVRAEKLLAVKAAMSPENLKAMARTVADELLGAV